MFDFSPVAADYAQHRHGFPVRFFEALERRGLLVPAERAVDLGTGTGTIAHGLARRGMHVVGVDRSEALLAQAARVAPHLAIRWVTATAEDTGLPSGAADLVTAGQCWHWFDRDRAAREVQRLLAPGGRVVIAHLDWLRPAGGVVDATLATMDAFGTGFPSNLDLGRGGLYPAWIEDLSSAGFVDLETFSFDVVLRYTQQSWRGRVRASSAVGGRLPPDEVTRFDAELAAALASRGDALDVPHRVWAVFGARGASGGEVRCPSAGR